MQSDTIAVIKKRGMANIKITLLLCKPFSVTSQGFGEIKQTLIFKF